MASWNNQPNQPAQPAQSSGRPTSNPIGGSLTSADIQIERLQKRNFDAVEAIKNSFELVKEYPAETIAIPIVAMIIYGIAQTIISLPFNLLASFLSDSLGASIGGDAGQIVASVITSGTSMFVSMISSLLMAVLLGAINIIWLRAIRGQKLEMNNMVDVKSFAISLIITQLIMQLAMYAGLAFLILPGIIIGLGLSMSTFLVIDKNLKPMDAIKTSWALMKGHKVELFIFGIILAVFNFVGMLALCVGVIFTYAISIGAMAMFYDRLVEPGNAYAKDIGNAPQVFS